MKTLIATTVIVLCAAAVAAAQTPRVRSDQEILMQLERDWDAAFHTQNVKFVESVLAEEFVGTYGDGSRGDRARELSIAATFDQQVDSSSLDDFIIKIYGDVAVVWFTQHLVGPVQGVPTPLTFRYIDVWVFRDGRWQCVETQSTKVL